jgi:hypothetical protein
MAASDSVRVPSASTLESPGAEESVVLNAKQLRDVDERRCDGGVTRRAEHRS